MNITDKPRELTSADRLRLYAVTAGENETVIWTMTPERAREVAALLESEPDIDAAIERLHELQEQVSRLRARFALMALAWAGLLGAALLGWL